MEKKYSTAAEITDEIISKWKSEHAKVVRYKTEDGKTAYFKNPDLTTVDAASALANSNPMKSNLLLAKACFLGGDQEIITEDKYLFGLGNHLKALIVKVEGELSEL
jgi:hypothetical protein